jgi:hypothetical protein
VYFQQIVDKEDGTFDFIPIEIFVARAANKNNQWNYVRKGSIIQGNREIDGGTQH